MELARPPDLATVEEDLEDAAEHACEIGVRAQLFLGQFVEDRDGLVPAAGHRQRVGRLAEGEHLGRAFSAATGESDGLAERLERLPVPVACEAAVRQVGVPVRSLFREIVLERVAKRMPSQRELLFGSPGRPREVRLRSERAGQRLRKSQRLRDSERQLVRLGGTLDLACKRQRSSQARSQIGDVGIGLVRRHGLERLLHPSHALLSAPGLHFETPESSGDAGRCVQLAGLREELQRCAQALLGCLELRVAQGLHARHLQEQGSLHRLVRELRGLLVGAARLPECTERSRALGGSGQELACARLDLARIVGVDMCLVGCKVVSGDDLGDLLLRRPEGALRAA